MCFCCFRATFCVALACICMCSVFWLFWLSGQCEPNDWLVRLNETEGDFLHKVKTEKRLGLIRFSYCFSVLLCMCLFPRPYIIHFILLWHDIASLLCKTNQPTNSPFPLFVPFLSFPLYSSAFRTPRPFSLVLFSFFQCVNLSGIIRKFAGWILMIFSGTSWWYHIIPLRY